MDVAASPAFNGCNCHPDMDVGVCPLGLIFTRFSHQFWGFISYWLTIRAFGSAMDKFWKPKLTLAMVMSKTLGSLRDLNQGMEVWFSEHSPA